MKTFLKTAAAAFAAAALAGPSLAQAPKPMSDTMSNSMTADCLKKAGMETDAMKRQQMTADCNKGGSMSSGSMSATPTTGGAMGGDMMKKDPMKK
ncbi:MAG: hypothetical protein AB7K86_18020 [Rhodospirillales bacterium]